MGEIETRAEEKKSRIIAKGKLRVHHMSARLPKKIASLVEGCDGKLHNYFLQRKNRYYAFNIFKPVVVTRPRARVPKHLSIDWQKGVLYFRKSFFILKGLGIKDSRKEDSFVDYELYEDGEMRFIIKNVKKTLSMYF